MNERIKGRDGDSGCLHGGRATTEGAGPGPLPSSESLVVHCPEWPAPSPASQPSEAQTQEQPESGEKQGFWES